MKNQILLVDDNTHAADAMGKLLTLVGFNINVVYSGEEALSLVRASKPKIMLLDIRMPEMDGYAVAKEVRADPKLSDITLVALTGFGQEEDKQKAEKAGFNHHITKPATLNDLKTVLTQYVHVNATT